MLAVGMTIRWNGQEQPVQEVTDDSATIGSETLSRNEINEYFDSHDMPFEIVN